MNSSVPFVKRVARFLRRVMFIETSNNSNSKGTTTYKVFGVRVKFAQPTVLSCSGAVV